MPEEPKVLSEVEMEAVLQGTNRIADRVILAAINNMTAAFLQFRDHDFPEHAKQEQEWLETFAKYQGELGTPELVRARVAFIDAQIEAQRTKTGMMRRVTESVAIWAIIAFLTYYATITYHDIKDKFSAPKTKAESSERKSS